MSITKVTRYRTTGPSFDNWRHAIDCPDGTVIMTKPTQEITSHPSAAETAIRETCAEVRDLLVEKNKSYGDSAFDPVRIFSKSDPLEAIRVRIDDKLSRIVRGKEYQGEETTMDLIGYLVLLVIAERNS